MYYDKRIRYLSYYESGIKLQNAGYVKFQVRDSLCQMVIYMKGPRMMGSGEAKVYLLSEKMEKKGDGAYRENRTNALQKHFLGTLGIRNGQGHCAVRIDAENMAGSGMRYDEICGIKIELHEYQYLESCWVITNVMPKRRNAKSAGKGAENWSGNAEGDLEEETAKIDLIVTPVSETAVVEKLMPEETAKEIIVEEMVEREIQREKEQMPEREMLWDMEETDTGKQTEEIRLSEQELESDKWEQLKKNYPIVHPIREEEEYLKIAPKDFVIFTEKYQELVHNSFLLHGYYNYKHLILGKKEKDEKTAYYLGVPGTFHEREKTVAVMFGFEAFDGKREPAQKGDFGYYLRRVEI